MKEENNILEASDGRELNLRHLHHRFEAQIEGLPKKEKKKLWVYYKAYQKKFIRSQNFARDENGVRMADKFKLRRVEVLELMGRYYSNDQIQQILKDEYGIVIGRPTLTKFRNDEHNAAIIGERQKIHRTEHSAIRLSYKKSRLEEYSWIFESEKDEYKLRPSTQRARNMSAILKDIRDEVEGHKLELNIKGEHDLQKVVKEQMAKEVFRSFNLKAVVIGRVAARYNINPEVINYALANSYYKDLDVAVEMDDQEFLDDFVYPSELTYDITTLEEENLNYQRKKKKIVKEAVVMNADEVEKMDKRKRQLKLLAQTNRTEAEKITTIAEIKEIAGEGGELNETKSGISYQKKSVQNAKKKKELYKHEGVKKNRLLERLRKKGISNEEALSKPTKGEKLGNYMQKKNKKDGVGNGEFPLNTVSNTLKGKKTVNKNKAKKKKKK